MTDRDFTGMTRAEFQAMVDSRRKARMDKVDAMTPGMRALVHEYGSTVVDAFLDIGVRKERHIRHLVETVLNEFSPTRGAGSNQGTRRAIGVPPPTER